MAISRTQNAEEKSELSEVKRKLAWRIAFAVLMILALLGGLALFDYFTARVEREADTPQFTEPVPVSKKVFTQPLTAVEPPAMPAQETKVEAEPEASAAPVETSATPLGPPPRPEVAAQPVLPRAKSSNARSSAQSRQQVAKTPSSPVEASSSPAPQAEQLAPPVRSQPTPPRLFSGYALQAGVFSDPRRAEDLHAKLTLAGIPSTIEARVQVGPFKSKAEALAAKAKLKELGVEALMLPKRGTR